MINNKTFTDIYNVINPDLLSDASKVLEMQNTLYEILDTYNFLELIELTNNALNRHSMAISSVEFISMDIAPENKKLSFFIEKICECYSKKLTALTNLFFNNTYMNDSVLTKEIEIIEEELLKIQEIILFHNNSLKTMNRVVIESIEQTIFDAVESNYFINDVQNDFENNTNKDKILTYGYILSLARGIEANAIKSLENQRKLYVLPKISNPYKFLKPQNFEHNNSEDTLKMVDSQKNYF